MSRWSTVIEAFHSVLIDELVERSPGVKPELGMPIRQGQWNWPNETSQALLKIRIFGDPEAIVALILDPVTNEALKLSGAEALWSAVSQRVPAEFEKRKIRLRLGAPVLLKRQVGELAITAPKGSNPPSRIIWIPIGVPGGMCFLGFGV